MAGAHLALMRGQVSRSRQLRQVSVATWAQRMAGVSDVRDVREIMTIAAAMDRIQASEIEAAMDILSQRILAIQVAKGKGGTWDKAEKLELIGGSGGSLASSALLALAS
eukprot:4165135-Lingulodinium_polyedra.AAC.1